MAQCSDCNYYRTRAIGDTTAGECRCNPPKAQGLVGVWPQVQPDDWCGLWEAIAAMEAPSVSPDQR